MVPLSRHLNVAVKLQYYIINKIFWKIMPAFQCIRVEYWENPISGAIKHQCFKHTFTLNRCYEYKIAMAALTVR